MKNISEMRKDFIKKDFIVDKLMKSNGLYCLVARPKVGKSLLALQLANSIATGNSFLGFKTNPCPVLYISTEMNSMQLVDRIDKMGLDFNDNNFLFLEQNPSERKLNLMDLQLDFQTFANEYKGRFLIIDMFSGIDLNNGYDLNNYQDMGQIVIPKFRELCKKYNFTILLVHHLNKNNTSLGSTAIDGSVDGKITLKQDDNIKNKIFLNYESRDYEGLDLVLKRNENLLFFSASDITSKLNLQITPSAFGKLLKNNLNNLEKEGLYIEQKRTAKERIYYAKYEEPTNEN